MGDVDHYRWRSRNRHGRNGGPDCVEDRDCGSGADKVKPLNPRTQAALKELMRSWDEALSEPVPSDMKELLAKLK